MIALYLAPFVIVLLMVIYKFIKRFFKENRINSYFSYLVCVLLFSGIIFSIFGFILNNNELKRIFTRLSFYWLGILLYFVLSFTFVLIITSLIRLIKKRKKLNYIYDKIALVFVLLFTVLMSTFGIMNAHKLYITNYEINVDKQSDFDQLNVCLIADLHLGYNNGLREVKDMVNKINSLNNDIVLIAGDIFDNEFEAIEDPKELSNILSSINSKYGTYAVLGNHDIDEKILMGFTFSKGKDVTIDEKMLEFINNSKINILYDEYINIDNIYIYGRPDKEKINFNNSDRKSVDEICEVLDSNNINIILEHEPIDAESLSLNGIDLYLNGHTHNGQIWPGTLTINLLWDNAYGYKQYHNMHNIVTSGVGLFGPNMRIDSKAEICDIKIIFNNKNQ